MFNLFFIISVLIYGFVIQRGKIGVQILVGVNKEVLVVVYFVGNRQVKIIIKLFVFFKQFMKVKLIFLNNLVYMKKKKKIRGLWVISFI